MHKITQSHFDVEIETPADGSSIADVVDEIGTRIHEYANQEDVTADFEIVFEIGSAFSVARTSPYVLNVVLEGTESADDVLDAIADDLYMMYDEMDSDYTDDAYDLRIDMDITPGRRRPTPPTPPTPPSDDGGAPDESVAEAEEALEEAIGDRLRSAVSGSTKLEDRATVARMKRIIKNADIEGVQFTIEFGDEYSVTEGVSGEVQVTLIEKRRTDAETVDRVISDIAELVTYATVQEVDAEVDQAVNEAALDEAEDSEELAEKIEDVAEGLAIEDWGAETGVLEEDFESAFKVKILEQLTREMREQQSEGGEPSNLYTSILDTLRDNPKYQEAFELPARFFTKYSPNLQAYAIVNKVGMGNSIKRLHDRLTNNLLAESRCATAAELQLLCWSLSVYNLSMPKGRQANLTLPEKDSRFDGRSMKDFAGTVEGDVRAVALPGVKALGLKTLVDVGGGIRDITDLAETMNSNAQRTYVADFSQATGDKIAALIRGYVDTVTGSEDIQRAIEVSRVWGGLAEGQKALALVASVNGNRLKRLHAALVETCKLSGAAASQEDVDVLAFFAYLFNKGRDQDVYLMSSPREGQRFDAEHMECEGLEGGRVGEVLVPGVISDRDNPPNLKALVTCTPADTRSTPPPLPSNAADYSDALEVVRGNDDLMTKLQIPEDRRDDADLMLNLIVRLANGVYRRKAQSVLSTNDYDALLEMVDEEDFINAVANSLNNFDDVLRIVGRDSELIDDVGIPYELSLSGRKKALIVNLANEARVRRVSDFFTDKVFASATRKVELARDADAVLDLAVELHNRTSRPDTAWSRRTLEVGESTGDDAVTRNLDAGIIAEIYFQGIAEDARLPSVVRIEE